MGLGLMFPILLLAMGIYVLVGAIKGSGRLFTMDNFKDDSKEKAKKVMRAIYFGLAAIMLLMSIVNGAQSVLYTDKVAYYKVTDAYRETFPDLLEDGQLTYTAQESVGGGSCMAATQTVEKTYGPYSVDNEKMTQEEISAFIQKAYSVYSQDAEKFPTTSGGMMNCMGGSVDYSKYYEATNRVEIVNGEDVPVYQADDPEGTRGHAVYKSLLSGHRSDADDGSFVVKMYNVLKPTLLTVLNYVLLSLAAVLIVLLFVFTRKFTDKEKLKKARAQQVAGPSMPKDAFSFDDETPSQNASKQ